MNLWEIQPQEIVRGQSKPPLGVDYFTSLIDKYKDSCELIVKTKYNSLMVEFNDKTLDFMKNGECMKLSKGIALLPGDEILIANKDKAVNELQLSRLKEFKVGSYIKRKGDINIIIPSGEKTIVINPKGWVLEYIQKPIFKENEVIEITKKEEPLKVGDRVQFNYDGKQIGEIYSIYNGGNTVNVIWNNKHTAMYYKLVKKLEC